MKMKKILTLSRPLEELVTMVMITHNRKSDTLKTLNTILSQADMYEVVIVDNASTDGTLEAIEALAHPRIRLIALAKNEGALARNRGVDAATTPYIAFSDDDSWWEEGAIARAVASMEKYPCLGLVAGRILVKDKQTLDNTSALQSLSPLEPWTEMPGPAILGFLGCGVIVRRQAYKEVGGYHALIKFSGEEELLGIDMAAAGWGMTYCEDVVGRHYPSTVRNMSQRYRMGARNVVLAAWMRRPFGSAMRKTMGVARKAMSRPIEWVGLAEGLLKLPLALRYRQVVPAWLEADIRLLEEQNKVLAAKVPVVQRQDGRQEVLATM